MVSFFNRFFNTKSSKNSRARSYFFTWNNYTSEDFQNLKNYSIQNCKIYTIQEEVGDNQTPHLQGFLRFKNAKDFKTLKSEFPKVHFEICRDQKLAEEYCRKDETRSGEVFTNNRRSVPDPLQGKVLRPFQQEVIKLHLSEPDQRSIYWYFDPEGGKGKTSLRKHLLINYPHEVFFTTGKPADVKYGVRIFYQNPENNLKTVIFDFSRSGRKNISYEVLEDIKNGSFYSPKYESGAVLMREPHVIVFSNFEPEYSAMSMDRWKITKL